VLNTVWSEASPPRSITLKERKATQYALSMKFYGHTLRAVHTILAARLCHVGPFHPYASHAAHRVVQFVDLNHVAIHRAMTPVTLAVQFATTPVARYATTHATLVARAKTPVLHATTLVARAKTPVPHAMTRVARAKIPVPHATTLVAKCAKTLADPNHVARYATTHVILVVRARTHVPQYATTLATRVAHANLNRVARYATTHVTRVARAKTPVTRYATTLAAPYAMIPVPLCADHAACLAVQCAGQTRVSSMLCSNSPARHRPARHRRADPSSLVGLVTSLSAAPGLPACQQCASPSARARSSSAAESSPRVAVRVQSCRCGTGLAA
jgi:hypothetical protein